MFGISTAWKSSLIHDGNQLLDELEQTGIPGLELEYRITTEAFQQIKKRLKHSALQVLSLHNYCPHPDVLPPDKASGDALLLSSPDEAERKVAVKYSLETIRNAHDLGATAVVFHLGKVAINRERNRWFELYDKGGFQDREGKQFFHQKLAERKQAQQPYFEALLKSLDQLNREADRLNIRIGAENRYYWNEIPNFDEIAQILDRFRGGKIGYWHDVGHAQAHETFGLCEHEKFLKAYSNMLIGVHLHDAKQVGYNDHFAPGTGLIDFDMVRQYLPENAIRIIEIHPKVSRQELEQGVKFLKRKGIIS